MDDRLQTDGDLAQAWDGGDERGYDAIVSRYAPLVYARCRRALGEFDADDATQAVFLVLARRREQAAASPALAAWLLRVAENVVRNARRDRERRRRAEASVPTPPPADDRAGDPDLVAQLDACMADLRPAEREAIALHYLAGHSLAEVAEQTRAGLSTVKDRLTRGLKRLRATCAERGLQLGMAPLVAGLQAEAQAPVPPLVMRHLNDLSSIARGAAATAAPSARVIRWSRQGLSVMTYATLVAVPTLIAIAGVSCSLMASESAPTQDQHPQAVAAKDAAPGLDLSAIVPERARSWYVLRWNDGARTAERARHLPEIALLGSRADSVLAGIASAREGVLVLDIDAVFPPIDATRQHRMQQRMANATPAEARRVLEEEMDRAMADTTARLEKAKQAKARGEPAPTGVDSPTGIGLPAIDGWVTFSDPAPALDAIGGLLGGGHLPFGWTAEPNGAAWRVRTGSGEISLSPNGPRLAIRSAGSHPDPQVRGLAANELEPRLSGADLEASFLLDPGNQRPVSLWSTIELSITGDGLRLRSSTPHYGPALAQVAAASPRITKSRLDAIPANAFLAAAVAMRPDDTRDSAFWQGMTLAMTAPFRMMERQGTTVGPALDKGTHIAQSAIEALKRIDGHLIAWIEPGSPLPTLTLEADLPREAADPLIDSTGMTPGEDGSVSVAAGMAMITLAWRDGRLICTTNPGGIAAIDRAGGFTSQSEIRRALAAMPGMPNACVLARPALMVHSLAPFVGMLAPQQAPRLADYEKRLDADKAYGSLTLDSDASGQHIEASGMFALIAGGVLAAQAMNPMHSNN